MHSGKGFVPSLCFTTPEARAERHEGFIRREHQVFDRRSRTGTPVLGLKCLTSKAFCVGNATVAWMRTVGPAAISALTPKVRQLRARETYTET